MLTSRVLWIPAVVGVAVGLAAGAEPVVVNDDGAWNWLQDPRAIIVGDKVVVASVALGGRDPQRLGYVEVTSCDLASGQSSRFTLHRESDPARARRWADDHSCPALLTRPDGRLVALYGLHGQEPRFYYRVTTRAGDATEWGPEQVLAASVNSRLAFPNLVHLSQENEGRGRMFALFRGFENRLMPSWAFSDDGGDSWSVGGLFVTWPKKVTPYVKYATDGRSTLHLAFTDGHRVDFHNGVYHAQYRDGQLWRSDGARIGAWRDGIRSVEDVTEVYRANADSVAMISDLELDDRGRPCVVYSVQMNTRPLRPRPIGADHRYRYARWIDGQWRDEEIAFAGTETHDAVDDDCTGLAAIDPRDVNVVFISTNADPVTGEPLISRADGKRHWEIFRGRTRDFGASWAWEPVTRDSTADNLRPIVPAGASGTSPVLWLRGSMRMPKESRLEVVGWPGTKPRP